MKDQFDLDLEKIAKSNPRVNLDQLRESIDTQERLRRLGHENKGFELTSPFERLGVPSTESGILPGSDRAILARS